MADLDSTKNEIGVIGLDAAGGGVAANLAAHQFKVAACPWGPCQRAAPPPAVPLAADVRELIANLRQPRTILICSAAADPANSIIEDLRVWKKGTF